MLRDLAPVSDRQFDYAELNSDARALVESCRDDIKRREKRAAVDIVEIGKRLLDAKAALPHGRFLPWLDAEFSWGQTTASKFMRVASAFGELAHSANFAPSALTALASGDVPDTVREHFIERAASGEPVRYAEVRDAIQALRPVDNGIPDDTPLFAVVDLETGQIVEPERAPLPGGPTPQQRAATNPARKWTEAMHDIWVRLNAVRDGGGIERVTAGWGVGDRAAFVEETERIIDVMTEWRAALKG